MTGDPWPYWPMAYPWITPFAMPQASGTCTHCYCRELEETPPHVACCNCGNRQAKTEVQESHGSVEQLPLKLNISAVMAALGKRGGKARAQALTEARRREIAAQGGRAGKGKSRHRPSASKKK